MNSVTESLGGGKELQMRAELGWKSARLAEVGGRMMARRRGQKCRNSMERVVGSGCGTVGVGLNVEVRRGVNGFAGTMKRGRKLWDRVDSVIKSWANSRGSGRGAGEGA